MSERHLDESELQAFVSGELEGGAALDLERHVGDCPHCAARLQRSAWLETAMYDVAAAMVPRPRPRRSWQNTFPAPLALAASLVLGLGVPGKWLGFDGEGPRASLRGPISELAHAGACDDDELDAGSCTDPTMGDDALALMTLPEVDAFGMEGDDGQLCEAASDGSDLSCPGEPLGG